VRILITGAQGQLGMALQPVLSSHTVLLKDLPAFDLTDLRAESDILDVRPDVVIHAAAYTNVDGAEKEPERAAAINVQGTAAVARAAQRTGARLVYISTDYVFNGTKSSPYDEEDAPHPINVYGRTKYEGELSALRNCRNTLVVRTAWLYGHHGQNFVKTIMRVAAEKPRLEVVADQRGCPTHADDLAKALHDLLRTDLTGICHVTNSGDCTWHEFAEAIVQLMGLQTDVRPITTAQAGRLARRPGYSVLGHRRFEAQFPPLPHWREALSRFVKPLSRLANAAG